ncbi:sigma-70 family RNA polymerase sigma factor [Paraflavitalea speifideaquila]|uniref:sigma-70 family RNA polymerase sigma factor n=1 Tax=Paraflavitalea speifideaquila TaxID=3076558 RepID=UPI0028F00B31|nr:sigma-70 family RNA polymerase sigma factor [Paraflavitalea speifideiaquila]
MNEITGTRQFDAGSFREVYEQFHTKVFRYYLKRAAVHETATELTQQVFVKLWQSRHTLSADLSFEIQLFTMANSVWIDHLRKEARNRKYIRSVDEFGSLADHYQDQPGMYALEVRDDVRLAMQQLPPVRKKVFVLKMFHGYSNQEIAGMLSVSVKTVEDHLWKAMRFIRSLLTMLSYLLLWL